MASLEYHSLCSIAVTLHLVLLPTASSTIADCAPRLLPLTPCAPFVQGTSPSPPRSCCDNLKRLYTLYPGCICQLLNNPNLNAFPINRTLALQLPSLCNLPNAISVCSGVPQASPTSPASQVSLGAHANSSAGAPTSNSSIAASPLIEVAPRPLIMGLGHASAPVPSLLFTLPLVTMLFTKEIAVIN
ncbi:hypothetical protein K2173_028266 [Erythroxylum novogranatense]|uniref:Bifunctional inhibitor/plant lipid transfer protein/seed storage helical domain-containing protein n=1 Tax=Erythroxylum novogranatense TaxID=1862640 RepID=A0AAV8U4D9_9ROSI|nr:hypothetical protein K2173_028266 [Erythroxylum novogranatense]